MSFIKFIKLVSRINSLGSIVQINNQGDKYSGLLIEELIEKNQEIVRITLPDGSSDKEPIKLEFPVNDFNRNIIKVIKLRDLIEENRSDQFIPVDKDNKLTLIPKEVRGINRVNNDELNRELTKLEERNDVSTN